MKKLLCFSIISLIIVSQATAHDFGTALSIATYNIPYGADVAGMGNADAAAWGWSSNNPAMTAFERKDTPVRGVGSIVYGIADFKKGPKLSYGSVSGVVKTRYGFFQVNYNYLGSGSHSTKVGYDTGFNPSKAIELFWANKIKENLFCPGDEFYAGLEIGTSLSKLTFSLDNKNLLKSSSRGNYGAMGFLYKPNGKINVGGYYLRSWERNRERDLIYRSSETSSSTSNKLKIGVGFQILPLTYAEIDYQLLNIAGSKENQVFAGVEQYVVKNALALYAGWANHSPTAGIGIYFPKGGFNLAYMENPFRELEPHFGKARIIEASIYFYF